MQTHTLSSFVRRTSVALFALSLGCTANVGSDDDVLRKEQEIIGGFTGGNVRTLEPVGSIVELISNANGGDIQNKCTGTLIGPRTVLTAANCIEKYKGKNSYGYTEQWFRLGVDAAHPTHNIRIISGEVHVVRDGGLGGRGADLGIVQLAEDITDVQPMVVSTTPLTNADIRTNFLIAGYGQQGVSEPIGTHRKRAVGRNWLATLNGHALQSVWPTFDGFLDWLRRNISPTITAAGWRPGYESPNGNVIPGQTAFFSGVGGGSQMGSGDSGGPIMWYRNGHLEIVAVMSNGYFAASGATRIWLAGSFGGLTATAETSALIARTLADRCRGVPVTGVCGADTAFQCNPTVEWPVPISYIDCAEFGMSCGVVDGEGATCVNPVVPTEHTSSCAPIIKLVHPGGAVYEFMPDGTYKLRGAVRGTASIINGVLRWDDTAGSCVGSTQGVMELTRSEDCTKATAKLISDGCRLRGESADGTVYTVMN